MYICIKSHAHLRLHKTPVSVLAAGLLANQYLPTTFFK